MSQEEQSYARAIEASLHASLAEDTYEDLLPEERIRPEGRCVFLLHINSSSEAHL